MIDEEMRYPDDRVEEKREDNGVLRWLPLLLIPIFVFIGWTARDYADQMNRQASSGVQYGVGGGPGYPCVSPSELPTISPLP
jgi:hypothetical protein